MAGDTPFVGEIRMFGGNFAPVGWMFCQGQTLPISEHEVLFNLIGTTYGGDGQQTFRLPDLSGRVPVHYGSERTTGTFFQLGEAAGVESVTLTTPQLPVHTHPMPASTQSASSRSAVGGVPAGLASDVAWVTGTTDEVMSTTSLTGGSQPHDNVQPYLGVSFIISLDGVYPTQS